METTPDIGIAWDLPADQLSIEAYHARDEWSSSQLKLLPDKPEEFEARYVSKWLSFDATDYMDKGTALHSLLFEGVEIAVIPQDVLAKNGAKIGQAWKEWRAEHPGVVLKESQADEVHRMRDAVLAKPMARTIVEAGGLVEHSIFWVDPETELGVRTRPDKIAFVEGGSIIVDLKSCHDSTPYGFRKLVAERRMHRQAALQEEGLTRLADPPDAMALIAVRNKPPYECWLHELSGRAMQLARDENHAALRDLKRRLEHNDWTTTGSQDINVMDLPEWYYREHEEQTDGDESSDDGNQTDGAAGLDSEG